MERMDWLFFFYQNKAPERTQTYRAGYVTCVCPHAFPTRNINRKVIRASILLIFYSGTLESPQHVFRIKLSFRIIFGILKLKFSTIVSTSQWEKMAEKLYKITDLSHISEMTLWTKTRRNGGCRHRLADRLQGCVEVGCGRPTGWLAHRGLVPALGASIPCPTLCLN